MGFSLAREGRGLRDSEGLTADKMVRMEQRICSEPARFRVIEAFYYADVLNLVVAGPDVAKLWKLLVNKVMGPYWWTCHMVRQKTYK